MEQVSNKTLTFLLIAAIVVSVGGTIISINRINRLAQLPSITGMAGSGTGYVNVTIGSVASISVLEGQIDFGSCSPNATIGSNLSSNVSDFSANSWGSPGVCSGSGVSAPDNITIKNDGNTFINVTVDTNTVASSLIGGNTPYPPQFLFMTRNASSGSYGASSYAPGCFNRTANKGTCSPASGTGGLQWNWKNFSLVNTAYCACDNLSYGTSANAIYLFAKLDVPADALQQGEQRATLTLTANEIP